MCTLDEPSDVWSETIVRARRPHRCCECGAPIPPGVKYVRIGSLYDHRWDTFTMHYECRVLWGAMAGDLCGKPWFVMAGGLAEELGQYHGELAAVPYAERFEQIKAKYTAQEPTRETPK